jgi:hypothetical protein
MKTAFLPLLWRLIALLVLAGIFVVIASNYIWSHIWNSSNPELFHQAAKLLAPIFSISDATSKDQQLRLIHRIVQWISIPTGLSAALLVLWLYELWSNTRVKSSRE